jgi:hypothetical protein
MDPAVGLGRPLFVPAAPKPFHRKPVSVLYVPTARSFWFAVPEGFATLAKTERFLNAVENNSLYLMNTNGLLGVELEL